MLLRDAISQYWTSRRRDFSACTIRDYELTFKRLIDFLGDVEMEAISSANIDRFLNSLADDLNLSPKTICNHWIGLSSLWTWAESQFDLPHIVRKVRRPRVHRRPSDAYSESDLRAMLNACQRSRRYRRKGKKACSNALPQGVRDRAIILTLLDSGIRASEMTALRVRDYDRAAGRLTILHGKGNKRRAVYLGLRAQRAVTDYLATRGELEQDEPLFLTRDGSAMTRDGLRQLLAGIGERAGVADAGAHRFRHTFGTNFLRNGGGELALQELLGHQTLSTTSLYVRRAANDLELAAKTASPADHWRL